MLEEIWKDVKGFEELYQVSNLGNVRSKERKIFNNGSKKYNTLKSKTKKQRINNWGYNYVMFSKDSKPFGKLVHRLVADAFIANKENLPQVNHKDGNKQNNSVENLEWCSVKENILHARFVLGNRPTIFEPKRIFCVELQKWFESCEEARKTLNIRGTNFKRIINTNRTYNGFHFTDITVPFIKEKYLYGDEKKVICIETKEIFESISDASRKIFGTIRKRCSLMRRIKNNKKIDGKTYF